MDSRPSREALATWLSSTFGPDSANAGLSAEAWLSLADRALAALPSEPPSDPERLDVAWAAAEAARPEGWRGPSLWSEAKGWCAAAVEVSLLRPMPVVVKGYPTPTAALRALAAALSEPTEPAAKESET